VHRAAAASLSIFAIALAVRVAWIVTLPETLVWADEHEFVSVARHLASGDGYVSGSYRANPVLPGYLAVVFRLFGEHYLVARLGQAFMGALTCVLVAATATRLLDARVGLVSGLLMAVYLPHVYLSGVFYVECIFTLLVALTLWCAVHVLDDTPRRPWLLATGASFALASLARPIFLAYLPALVAALVWAMRAPLVRRLASAGLMVGSIGLMILPWTLRNYYVLGTPVVVSTGFGTKLWQGNNEGADADPDDRELFFDQAVWKERVAALPAAERVAVEARYRDAAQRIEAAYAEHGDANLAYDAVLGPLAVEFIRTHPDRAFALFIRKLGVLFLPFSKTLTTNIDTSSLKRSAAIAAYIPILVLALLGAWWCRGRGRGLALVYGLVASIAGTYAVLTTCTRFRLPLDPYLVMFAAAALVELAMRSSSATHALRTPPAANAARSIDLAPGKPLSEGAHSHRREV
jgi:4-amino-4-deoxy-L-arabinose transferase-like glycosyltransferase